MKELEQSIILKKISFKNEDSGKKINSVELSLLISSSRRRPAMKRQV